MARFDVRANLNRASRARVPFLVELQADMLSALHTCLVAPLVPSAEFGPPATRLNPEFRIGNRKFVMDTALRRYDRLSLRWWECWLGNVPDNSSISYIPVGQKRRGNCQYNGVTILFTLNARG